jgi:uncharacterized RDD family membrane protein YckC
MSQIKIPTSLNIDLLFELSPFHKRLLAWVVDIIIFIFYIIIIDKFQTSLHIKENKESANNYWLFMILFLPIAMYPLVLEYTLKGQTIGKKLLRIRVINETGGDATLSQYLLRWLLRVADFILLIMIILLAFLQFKNVLMMTFTFCLAVTDVLCVALTTKAQRLGDMAAGTIVINTKTKNILNETVFMDVEDNYQVLYPQVMKLTDRDLNTINTIYNNLSKRPDYALANNIAYKIQSVLKISTNQDATDFIETILKDYNYMSTR